MASFKDHFSSVAGAYRAFRPGYPPELFARHFGAVLAVDPGREQIRNAIPLPA